MKPTLPVLRSVWLLPLLLTALPAAANDRPFQSARTAVAEEDDNGSWSFESWVQRYGRVRGFSVEPEYTFTPTFSVQMELTRRTDRGGAETGHEAEVEFKYLFNHIARDDWGLGVSAAVAVERTRGEGTRRALTLKLPFSLALGEGAGHLHLNAGVVKPSDARREFTVSGAIEGELFKRTLVFAELAREGDARFGQVGARYWMRRDKLALDFSLQQHRSNGERQSGFILGVGWYDL